MSANVKQTAIITGASQGIGKAIALYLASQGYGLLLVSRNDKNLKIVSEEIQTLYPNNSSIEIAALDVADYPAVQRAISAYAKKYGRIDLLCNNAGYAKRGSSDLPQEEFIKMLNTNLIGAFNFIQTVAPYMKKNKSGRIINISSRSGVVARKYLGGYAASKFGLMGLNEGIYKELAHDNIYVTAICPAFVATEMTADMDMDQNDMIQTSDIVRTIDFLLKLSPSVSIPKIVLECKNMVMKEI